MFTEYTPEMNPIEQKGKDPIVRPELTQAPAELDDSMDTAAAAHTLPTSGADAMGTATCVM